MRRGAEGTRFKEKHPGPKTGVLPMTRHIREGCLDSPHAGAGRESNPCVAICSNGINRSALRKNVCDDAVMSEHTEPGPAERAAPWRRREDLTTHQLRAVGQRRADAEEKLARHLKEARHPAGEHPAAGEKSPDD